MHIALYTFGIFKEPADHPANDGFHEINDPIFELVERAPGFVARSGYASDPGPVPWGPEIHPEFYVEKGDGWTPATLSLWQDLASIFAFTYYGLHKEAYKRGREWNVTPNWPPYVMWWHDGTQYPRWSDAVARHKLLHELGPTSEAFNFKAPYNKDGQHKVLDMQRIKTWRNRIE